MFPILYPNQKWFNPLRFNHSLPNFVLIPHSPWFGCGTATEYHEVLAVGIRICRLLTNVNQWVFLLAMLKIIANKGLEHFILQYNWLLTYLKLISLATDLCINGHCPLKKAKLSRLRQF
jgi:hypothetical protein